jgi:hypothetical protein
MVFLHWSGCILFALSLCAWEDYTVAFVPHDTAVPRRPHAILGMAFGQQGFQIMEWNSRDDTTLQDDTTTSTTTLTSWPPRPYNDIMFEHRHERVPRWKTTVTSKAAVQMATRDLYQAFEAVESLKEMAMNYEWDTMRTLVQTPVLRQTLERACNTLRNASPFLSVEARREIGFHWGR